MVQVGKGSDAEMGSFATMGCDSKAAIRQWRQLRLWLLRVRDRVEVVLWIQWEIVSFFWIYHWSHNFTGITCVPNTSVAIGESLHVLPTGVACHLLLRYMGYKALQIFPPEDCTEAMGLQRQNQCAQILGGTCMGLLLEKLCLAYWRDGRLSDVWDTIFLWVYHAHSYFRG